jgi:carbonic anhydrase
MSEVTSHIVQKNEEYAKHFDKGDLPLPPAQHYLLLTCMDARIDPSAAFGIPLGAAHVVRNAGGSTRDALRSIVISQQLLATTQVLVVKHTDCGMLTFTNEAAREKIKGNLGEGAKKEVEGMDFLPFKDLDQAVKDDVAYLKDSKLIPENIDISGWVYDVKTGKVRSVK